MGKSTRTIKKSVGKSSVSRLKVRAVVKETSAKKRAENGTSFGVKAKSAKSAGSPSESTSKILNERSVIREPIARNYPNTTAKATDRKKR